MSRAQGEIRRSLIGLCLSAVFEHGAVFVHGSVPGRTDSTSVVLLPDGHAAARSTRRESRRHLFRSLRDIRHHIHLPNDTSSSAMGSWFKSHGFSANAQRLRDANPDFGDGTVDQPQWRYFNTTCMQQRQKIAATLLLRAGCQHVVEIGGYLSPLDRFLRTEALTTDEQLPGSYVNIDPSVHEALDFTNTSMRSVHIPMTLADFVAAETFRGSFSLDHPNVCACILSVWDPHVQKSEDKSALRQLLQNTSLLVASAAGDELEHLETLTSIAQEGGRLKRDKTALVQSHQKAVVDCSVALKDEKTHWQGDEVEYLRVFNSGHQFSL